ncbi:hypothetical protein DSECCO2_623130 [anaerobic digester metagenome]
MQNGGFLLSLRTQNLRFLVAFGHQNLARLFTLRAQNALALFTLGLHLLLHRVLNFLRRNDVFKLNAVDLDAPFVGGGIKDGGDARVDNITRGQRVIQLHIADNVSQRRSSKVFNRRKRALYAVGIKLGVGNLKKHDGVDLHGDVILGDNGLRLKIHNLLFDRNLLGNAVKKRHLDVQTGFPRHVISAETLDNINGGLRHNAYAVSDGVKCHNNNDQQHKGSNDRRHKIPSNLYFDFVLHPIF